MERFCRECGAPINGRENKCFCNDICRTAWHNRRYRESPVTITSVNRILKRNHIILERIYSQGLRSVPLADRRVYGFNRCYFTSVERPLFGPPRYHLYEFVFSIRSGRICRLRKEGS